jgi:hypothetical protein
MDVNQQPKRQNMAQIRKARRLAARRGEHYPGMPRNNPLLVIFLGVFVFLPLMFLGGLWLAGLLTGNWQAWNWLMGLVGW